MPVKIISEFNIYDMIKVVLVVIIFVSLAFLVFYKGLKRYSSTNLMNARV